MKVTSYVINKEVLTESQLELLENISGAYNSEVSFVIKTSDIKNCVDTTISLNNGEEVMDCAGRVWVPDYTSDIIFMTKLLTESKDCDYIIIEFNNYTESYAIEED